MVARETSISSGLSSLGIRASSEEVSRLVRFADLLVAEAIPRGLLGPNEGGRVVARHILESAAILPHLPSHGAIVDVGSGAGLPGLVLAVLGREVTLVEPTARRADFLRACGAGLRADVRVKCARAEDLGRGELRESFRAAVARALAEMPVALELCLPLVEVGGMVALLASRDLDEPQTVGEGGEVAAVASPLLDLDRPEAVVAEMLGGGTPEWIQLAVPGSEVARWVMIVGKLSPTPDRFPRRAGVPRRRPLG